MISAFARSRILLAREDVSPHMVKWWKKIRDTDGEVIRHLSPYEQQVLMPWVRTWPKKAYDKFMEQGIYWIATTAIVAGTAILSDQADAAEDFSHRY